MTASVIQNACESFIMAMGGAKYAGQKVKKNGKSIANGGSKSKNCPKSAQEIQKLHRVNKLNQIKTK